MLTELEKETMETVVKATVAALVPEDARERLLGKGFDQLGELFEEGVIHVRLALLLKTLKLSKEIAHAFGRELGPVPTRLLLPILNYASIEDNESLQLKWAALLVNASTSTDAMPPAFPEILHNLSPVDADTLDRMYNAVLVEQSKAQTRFREEFEIPQELIQFVPEITRENFLRLGLIRKSWLSDEHLAPFVITVLGRSFLEACRSPHNEQED